MNTYEAALREIETLPTGDPFHAMVKARQIARKALAVPAPPSAQEVVGPQGREDFIQKVIGYTFGNEGFRFKAMSDKIADFMRANWPVSEGEGMNGWISVENRLPDEILCCFWCRVPVVEPPHVGSLIDDNFPDPRLEYYTHWKKIENTFFPQPLPSPPQNQK